jgi:hypothetical protein
MMSQCYGTCTHDDCINKTGPGDSCCGWIGMEGHNICTQYETEKDELYFSQ